MLGAPQFPRVNLVSGWAERRCSTFDLTLWPPLLRSLSSCYLPLYSTVVGAVEGVWFALGLEHKVRGRAHSLIGGLILSLSAAQDTAACTGDQIHIPAIQETFSSQDCKTIQASTYHHRHFHPPSRSIPTLSTPAPYFRHSRHCNASHVYKNIAIITTKLQEHSPSPLHSTCAIHCSHGPLRQAPRLKSTALAHLPHSKTLPMQHPDLRPSASSPPPPRLLTPPSTPWPPFPLQHPSPLVQHRKAKPLAVVSYPRNPSSAS